jgi:repressor LexA
MKELTDRQKQVLSFIANYIKKNSYPPTIREIADHFGISVKGAHDHITALRKKGHLRQADKRPRTMGLIHLRPEDADFIEIPILGTVAAGLPIMAEENFDGNILLHRSMLKKNKKYFALKVKGKSMIGAGILPGDTAIIEKQISVRNGEIAVVVVFDEKDSSEEGVTLKRFYKESARIRLDAENPDYKARYYNDVKILGRLFTIIRSY